MLEAISVYDKAGLVGVVVTLLAYFLLQVGRTALRGWLYSILNVIGSSLILVSLFVKFNLSAFVMEAIWVLISVYGVYKVYQDHKRRTAPIPHDDDDMHYQE